jgi:hypothetical protein
MPWRTRKKGTSKQRGNRFFLDEKSQQQKKMALPRIQGQSIFSKFTEDEEKAENKEADKEQILYAVDIGTVHLTEEQLQKLNDSDSINAPYEAPPEGYRVQDGIPVNNQSFFSKLKQRILTKPNKANE